MVSKRTTKMTLLTLLTTKHVLVFSSRHRNSSSIFATKLKAIFQCLQTNLQLPDPPYRQRNIIFFNSLLSIQSISEHFFTHALTERIHTLPRYSFNHYIHLDPESYRHPEKQTR